MNENLNLVEILKDVPEGTELYSPAIGNVSLVMAKGIDILVHSKLGRNFVFTRGGYIYQGYNDAECLLFPSKDQRDWSKFEIPLKDKELVWAWDDADCFGRELRFFDKKSNTTFGVVTGRRGQGNSYEHYERFKGEWPEWAKEAVKKLED